MCGANVISTKIPHKRVGKEISPPIITALGKARETIHGFERIKVEFLLPATIQKHEK